MLYCNNVEIKNKNIFNLHKMKYMVRNLSFSEKKIRQNAGPTQNISKGG